MAVDQRYFGTVSEFDISRGIGTITMDDSEQNVSVRYSAISGEGVRILEVGQRVSFELEEAKKGMSALRVNCE